MAKKTNTNIGDYEYFRITRKVGMRQNKRGEWVAQYKQFYGKSRKEAIAKYEEYMSSGSLNASTCLGEFVSWYIDAIFLPDDSLKDSTKTIYLNAYHDVFADAKIAGARIDDITGADLQEAISLSNVSATTIGQSIKFIRHFYSYLESQRISHDISGGLVAPKVEHKTADQDIIIYTDEEINKFLCNTPDDHRLRLLIVLAMNTGARIGELAALTYEDIKDGQLLINKQLVEIEPIKAGDENKKTRLIISETKEKSSIRSIPLSQSVLDELAAHKKWHFKEMLKNGYRTNYIFTTSTGNFYYKSTIRKSFNRLCKKVGVEPKGFHSFRRTFGTKLAAKGVPIQTLCKLMGHSDISITAKYYINISTDEKAAAIAALNYQ